MTMTIKLPETVRRGTNNKPWTNPLTGKTTRRGMVWQEEVALLLARAYWDLKDGHRFAQSDAEWELVAAETHILGRLWGLTNITREELMRVMERYAQMGYFEREWECVNRVNWAGTWKENWPEG